MGKGRILIADGDLDFVADLCDHLASWGYDAVAERDGLAALRRLAEVHPLVVIADLSTPRLDGFALLRQIRTHHPDIVVIILTAHGSIESAMRALQEEGVYNYFEKPVDMRKLRLVIDRAVEYGQARRENEALRRQLQDRGAFGELVGASEAMRQIYALIEQVAPSSASVLITGESGTGKEMVARTIHTLSPRREAPFIAINCSAIPETLMVSVLFGHERGAFTGAVARRQGCFELANSGTLLLDEVAEMPPSLQAKLLRVLEERKVRRLGGSQEIPVDVRVLAATNKDPVEAVRAGTLREDLLYRLNVITIALPPLRERKEDIPLLAQHLITQLAAKHNRPARFLSQAALEALQAYNWPGNVRELRNAIERAVIICSGEQIERHHIAPYPVDQRTRPRDEDTITLPIGTPLEEVERQMILRTLQKCDGNRKRAAALLQISLKTLHNKLRLYRERGLIPESHRLRPMNSAKRS